MEKDETEATAQLQTGTPDDSFNCSLLCVSQPRFSFRVRPLFRSLRELTTRRSPLFMSQSIGRWATMGARMLQTGGENSGDLGSPVYGRSVRLSSCLHNFSPLTSMKSCFVYSFAATLIKRPGIAYVPAVAGRSFVPTEALNSRLPTEFPSFSASYTTSQCQPRSFHHFHWPTFTHPFPLTFHIFSAWLLHIRSVYHPPS